MPKCQSECPRRNALIASPLPHTPSCPSSPNPCIDSPSPLLPLTAGGAHLRTTVTDHNGQPKEVPDYASVQGILIGVVAAFVLVVTIIGPENIGSHFEKHKTAFEEGGGRDELEDEGVEGGEGGSSENSRPTSVQVVDEKRSSPEPV